MKMARKISQRYTLAALTEAHSARLYLAEHEPMLSGADREICSLLATAIEALRNAKRGLEEIEKGTT